MSHDKGSGSPASRNTDDTWAPPGRSPRKKAKTPERIGHYRILDSLGEGGMGRVYRAEQDEPVKREVAIKLMGSSFANREDELRFDAERQTLARLSHRNVAQMYEAGTTEEGYPNFAMELVPGDPITEHCERKSLSIEDRLDLFLAVCEGVAHAHQKGVLHRDLKPSNLIVTDVEGCSVPKVIDFGIAKALDQPLIEETLVTGRVAIGTPSYMSPEAFQTAKGDVHLDTRSDVYSLGVLLF